MAQKQTLLQKIQHLFKRVVQILDIPDFDERAFITYNFRYMLLITALAILYIGNTRYAERQLRKINDIQAKLKELRWEYMSTTSDLMLKSKQTEVAKLVAPLGLEELKQPPKKIVVIE